MTNNQAGAIIGNVDILKYLISYRGVGLYLKRKEVLKIVTQNTKSPPKDYTDIQWQSDFEELKLKVKQSSYTLMPSVREVSETIYQEYHGKTQYQRYCDFINSVLKSIRKGEIDYCFYIYQIAELLKYEHDNLNVIWLEAEHCFRVFLANKK